MQPNETTQANETPTRRAETGLSHSRRGFLRKAAAVGLAGMAGGVATTGTASAALTHRLTVRATGGGHWHYRVTLEGTAHDIDKGRMADRNDTDKGDEIVGKIYRGNYDNYYYSGVIVVISAFNYATGDTIIFRFPQTRGADEMFVQGTGGKKDYYILATEDIDRWNHTERNDNDRGDAIQGSLFGGVDRYKYTDLITYISVDNNISFDLDR